MALGSSFPPEFLRGQIQRQLVPGAVIKLRAVMDDGKLQEKRFVVLHVDENTVCCVINSVVGAFLQAQPTWVLGHIAPELRNEIIGALKFAPTLSPSEVARLCGSLAA